MPAEAILVLLLLILLAVLINPFSSGAAKQVAMNRLKRTVSGSLTTRPPDPLYDTPETVTYTIQWNNMPLSAQSKFHDKVDVEVWFVLGGYLGARFADGSRRVDVPMDKSNGTASASLHAVTGDGDYLQVFYNINDQASGGNVTIQGERVDFETIPP